MDGGAVQPLGGGAGEDAVFLRDPHTHAPQRLQMQINGAGTELTAAGVAEGAFAHPAEHRAKEDDGRAHFLHERLRDDGARRSIRADGDGVAVHMAFAADAAQDAARGINIGELRAVGQHAFSPAEECGCQDGERAVFGALHRDIPLQPPAALNDEFLHFLPLLSYSIV